MALDEQSLESAVVVDCEGKEVGNVLEVHRDAFSGRPAWVAVRGGLLHGKSLVPVGDTEPVDGRLQVPYDAATIRKAPYVDLTSEELVEEETKREGGEAESIHDDKTSRQRREDVWALYEYYGLPFGRPDTTGAASPEAEYGFGSAGTTPDAEGAARTPEEIAEAYPDAPGIGTAAESPGATGVAMTGGGAGTLPIEGEAAMALRRSEGEPEDGATRLGDEPGRG
ncbi:MAG: PRC-barrel domain-containing protein [Frankiaceae bacterium]